MTIAPTVINDLPNLIEQALDLGDEAVADLVRKHALAIAQDDKLIKSIINFYITNKSYAIGYEIAVALLKALPFSNKLLYYTSYLARKAGSLAEGAELGERLRHREPLYLPNLLNLCYTYIKTGNQKRAKFMHDKAATIEPDNKHIKILAQALA